MQLPLLSSVMVIIPKIFCPIFVLFVYTSHSLIQYDQCVDSAMAHIMNQNYDKAHTYLIQLIKNEPDNIDAVYTRLCVYMTQLLDYESYIVDGKRVLSFADSVFVQVTNHLHLEERTQISLKYLFFKGNIFGFKGLILAKSGKPIQGVKLVRTSIKIFKQILTRDSTCYDALFNIGFHSYYIGQVLKWVPFMHLKIREGFADIEKASKSSSPFRYGIYKSLLEIYLERKDYKKADSLASKILQSFPNNTIFLGIKAKASLLRGNYLQARGNGERLIFLSQKRDPNNWVDLTAGYQIVIAALYYLKRYDECRNFIKEVDKLTIPQGVENNSYVTKHLKLIKGVESKLY